MVIGAICLLVVLVGGALRRSSSARRSRRRSGAVVHDPSDHTTRHDTGAVRSVQSAELSLPAGALEQIWSPQYLERLARTYWRFLTRVTLGVIRVRYSHDQRFVVALIAPLKLLIFRAPEYEMDEDHGLVRWRIERGLLVARRGRGGRGYLKILVRRLPSSEPGRARLFIEIEVASFYPAIAFGLSRRLYDMTQSRIHVIVTKAFLRSLARLDFAESRVGALAQSPDGAAAGGADAPQR
jgi:hypothetical protein